MSDPKVNTLQSFAQNNESCLNYIISYSINNKNSNKKNIEINQKDINKDDIINKIKTLMSEMLNNDNYKEIRKSLLQALSILTDFKNIEENYANKLLYNSTIYMIAILLEQELNYDDFVNLFRQNIDLLMYINYPELYEIMINFIENVNLNYFKCLRIFFKLYNNEDNYIEIIKNENIDSDKIKNDCVKIKEIRLKKEKEFKKNIEKNEINNNKIEDKNKNKNNINNNKISIESLQEEIIQLKIKHNLEINNLTNEINNLKQKNTNLENEINTLKNLFQSLQEQINKK
jgi:hypothetical protein